MKSQWLFWTLAACAAIILGASAVWLGGINQDEGWYLYAANLVSEGQMPYRDFSYTQGPMLPYVYSAFTGIWKSWGLLGARVFTLSLGVLSILFAMALAGRLAPAARKGTAELIVLLLLGCNLYHLYFLAIPKTYALAGLFAIVGFWLLSVAVSSRRISFLSAVAGLSLAFAAGTRISLGILLAVAGLELLLTRKWKMLVYFCLGGFGGLALVYLPFLCDASARAGLIAAQQYHSSRGGFDIVWTIGSFSRLVRWYLPLFIILGLGVAGQFACRTGVAGSHVLILGFISVFAVQMLAPFPYEDYQVPIIALLAVYAAVNFVGSLDRSMSPVADSAKFQTVSNLLARGVAPLLVLGLAFATSFGSPLLEKWMTNGQDRFWSLKKAKCELAQLRDVARRIEEIDPDGKTLLTQDLYLAIETNRKVPKGLEMGPFAIMTDDEWRRLLSETAPATCAVAALSGYSFAIDPPKCNERPVNKQLEYWTLLRKNYTLVEREDAFGQNATPLLVLKKK